MRSWVRVSLWVDVVPRAHPLPLLCASGMSKVVKDVSISAAKTQGEIAEDIAAISALCQAAVATLNSIRFGPQEDLHPAELVLHYRLRSVAASLGILLPVGTDARTVDFSQVEPGGNLFLFSRISRCCLQRHCMICVSQWTSRMCGPCLLSLRLMRMR